MRSAVGTNPQDGFPIAEADPEGEVCSQAAHIRKVNPRDLNTDQGSPVTTLVHRMLRRGIPYGPPLPPGATEDPAGQDRGLLFLSYQASIREQFEFVVGAWTNDSAKPSPFAMPPGSGFDMIMGQNPNHAQRRRFCRVGATGGQIDTTGHDIREWVTATGGGYFFAPSRSAMGEVLVGPQVQ